MTTTTTASASDAIVLFREPTQEEVANSDIGSDYDGSVAKNLNKESTKGNHHEDRLPQYKTTPSNNKNVDEETNICSSDNNQNDNVKRGIGVVPPATKDARLDISDKTIDCTDTDRSDKEPLTIPKKYQTRTIIILAAICLIIILLVIVLCLVAFLKARNESGVVDAFKNSYQLNTTTIIESQQELGGETIPTQLAKLTELTIMQLFSNKLTGTAPSHLGQLTALTSLWIYNNELSGTLPSELGLLTQLTELSLPFNQFSGPIPSQLGLLTRLSYLSFRENDLTGTIPWQLGQLTKLTTLKLSKNFLVGQVPTNLCELSKLTYIEVDCYMDCNCYRCSSCAESE